MKEKKTQMSKFHVTNMAKKVKSVCLLKEIYRFVITKQNKTTNQPLGY